MVPVHAGLSGFSRTLGEPKASPSCAGNRGHGQQMSHRALTFSSTLTPPPLDSQWAPSRTRGLPRWAHHHDELLLARPAAGRWQKLGWPAILLSDAKVNACRQKSGYG